MQAAQLHVVMKGRHAEDSFAIAKLEAAYLKDHAHGLDDKKPPRDGQQQFLLDDQGGGCESPAEAKGTGIAHEDFRRMGVEP